MFNLVAHCTGLIYQEGKFLLPFITNVLISLWRSSWSNTELKVKFQPVLWNPCAWNQTTNNNKNPPKNNPQSRNKNGRDMPNTYKSNSRCSLSFLKHHLCTFLPDKKDAYRVTCILTYPETIKLSSHQSWKKWCVNCETFQCLKIELPVVGNILCTCRERGEEKNVSEANNMKAVMRESTALRCW